MPTPAHLISKLVSMINALSYEVGIALTAWTQYIIFRLWIETIGSQISRSLVSSKKESRGAWNSGSLGCAIERPTTLTLILSVVTHPSSTRQLRRLGPLQRYTSTDWDILVAYMTEKSRMTSDRKNEGFRPVRKRQHPCIAAPIQKARAAQPRGTRLET